GRPQIRARSRHTDAVPDGQLPQAGSFEVRSIEIACAAYAQVATGRDEGFAQRVYLRGDVGHVHGTPRTVDLVGSPHMVFELLEVGKHLTPCPAGIAGAAPVVEVCGLTPHVHHRVDRTGAAEHFAAWPVGAAIRERRIGFS